MLALLSDLHFCDGTAIPGNVPPETFALAIREIYELAEQVARARDEPTKLDLVFLGDIFDFLRTERWFEDAQGNPVPLSERPWGSVEALTSVGTTPAALAHARRMMDEILAVNRESLAILRGEALPPPPGVEPRRIYIPGNHDRLYLHDEALRYLILGSLGAVDGRGRSAEGIHLHRLEMPEYGTIARHGHEWDMWNFPSYRAGALPSEYADEDYLPAPIGDAVTTEMATALPYEIRQRLLDSRLFDVEAARRIHAQLKRIEDVRPLLASFHWAYFAVERISNEMDEAHARVLRMALDDSIQHLAARFRELDFYQAWYDERHEALSIDAPVLLRLILAALSCESFPARRVAEAIEHVLVWRNPIDAARRGAVREILAPVGREEMRFVIYGHTHGPTQVPLHGSAEVQDVYLNTGTYRPGVFRADDGVGFVGWQRMAYTVVLSADEAVQAEATFGGRNVGPAFVSWIGGRSAGAPLR